MTNPVELEAFKKRTEAVPSGCIEWIGNIDGTGYGRFCFQGHIELAHRSAWRLLKGELPKTGCVLHRCDNRPCVNPEHLFLGDRGDNARDMASKGRQWIQQNPERRADTLTCPIELRARGEGHGMAILNEAQVLAIRERSSGGELGKKLAIEFDCSTSLITAIVRGQIWKHVGGPIRSSQFKGKKA